MKKLVLLLSLIPSLCYAQVGGGVISINTNTVGGGGGGGGGTPAGATNSIQFKVDSSTFGGSNWLADGGTIFFQPTDYLTENGQFRFHIDSAAHDPGERRDDIFSMGWNQNNLATDQGSSTLVFEAFCGVSVGCTSDGQSETYFSLDDGQGNSARPIGMFQSFDGTGNISGIFRFDGLGFFNRAQDHEFFSISDNLGIGSVRLFDSVLTSDISNGTSYVINGNNALGWDSGTSSLRLGQGGANITLAAGGDGSAKVLIGTNHFQLGNPVIEDGSGNTLINFSSDGPFPSFNGNNGDALIYTNASGPGSNIGWMIQPKGDGSIRLNTENSGAGSVYFQTANIKVGTFPGATGVTASGTVCTITAITAGIITGASCTP